MIKADRVDDHEFFQVVFIRHVISMPCDDIKRRVILRGSEQVRLEFRYYLVVGKIAVFKPRSWRKKVASIGEAIGTVEILLQ